MGYQSTNVFLGGTLVGQTYLGEHRIDYTPFDSSTPYVTDGLVLYMDSTIAASYPGTGTNWYNLVAGQPFTGSLGSSVTYTDGYLQTISTAGANGIIDLNFSNYSSQNYTVVAATRYTDTSSNGRMLAGKSNNWLLGNFSNSTLNYYAEGAIYGIPGGPNDTNWRIYTGTGNLGTDRWDFYLNDTTVIADSIEGVAGPNGLRIGVANNNTEYSDGQVCFVMVYNRVLSSAEVVQNYAALKSKVGLT
jgi:hypothetical protein